jgi:1-phosphatidylinositol-3-phosphate 5-kinase
MFDVLGFPLPILEPARNHLKAAVTQDSMVLSKMKVVDYSLLVGIDYENHELVVGIIDYLCHYDILKKIEYIGKVLLHGHIHTSILFL